MNTSQLSMSLRRSLTSSINRCLVSSVVDSEPAWLHYSRIPTHLYALRHMRTFINCCFQGSRIRSVRILFFERYVRTLTYSILAYTRILSSLGCFRSGTDFISLLILLLFLFFFLLLERSFQKKPDAPPFQTRSGWNLARMFFV